MKVYYAFLIWALALDKCSSLVYLLGWFHQTCESLKWLVLCNLALQKWCTDVLELFERGCQYQGMLSKHNWNFTRLIKKVFLINFHSQVNHLLFNSESKHLIFWLKLWYNQQMFNLWWKFHSPVLHHFWSIYVEHAQIYKYFNALMTKIMQRHTVDQNVMTSVTNILLEIMLNFDVSNVECS